MSTAAAFRSLGAIDVRNVARDPLLRWIAVLTPAIALLVRFSAPPITESLGRRFALNLAAFYPLLMSFLPTTAGAMTGTVIGFLLLDQRDDGTLPALLVTPLTLTHYLAYRLGGLLLVSATFGALMVPLAGLSETTVLQITVSAVVAAPLAPIYALFLSTFAANKVQGFALIKALGIVAIPCVAAYFVQPPWEYAFSVLPHYWPLKVFWLFDRGASGMAALHALLGIAWQALILLWLVRRFSRAVRS